MCVSFHSMLFLRGSLGSTGVATFGWGEREIYFTGW